MNYYKSIDFIPIFNFFMASEKNDLRYLLKLDDYENLPEIDKVLQSQLENTFIEIILQFPENSFDNDIIHERLAIAKLEAEMAINNDRSLSTIIEIKQKQLDSKLAVKSFIKSDYYAEIINIESILKISIDEKTCTLKKFFQYRLKALQTVKNNKRHE